MYLVVFRNRKRADIDMRSYDAEAEAMAELAARQPGFLSFKSYRADDDEVIAVSEWSDEASALSWRRNHHHAAVQARGRSDYYADYTMFACDDPRIHRFP